jgi:electron transfer flavoprotein alpha subunit
MTREILVVAERFRGQLTDTTFEMLGRARDLARALGGPVEAVLLGHNVAALCPQLAAADRVVLFDHPHLEHFVPETYQAVLAHYLKEKTSPLLVLLGATSEGLDLLSLLSAHADVPCIDNCVLLSEHDHQLLATCQIYGGKMVTRVVVPESTTLVAVVPGSFSAEEGRKLGTPPVAVSPLPPLPESRARFWKWLEPPPGDVDISKAAVLVAVGRGIQNADNLPLAEELAQTLGGTVCASRPVIDQGWLPLTRQVGKSGMTVKPKLYLAFGISGAPEHLEGMKQSELIIAVNTDPQAPFFSAAHYGAVADAVELLPLLTEEIRKRGLQKVS